MDRSIDIVIGCERSMCLVPITHGCHQSRSESVLKAPGIMLKAYGKSIFTFALAKNWT